MNNMFILFIGELQRMKKYNILAASVFAAFVMIGILHFTKIEDVTNLFPLLIFLDATSMAMLMIGVTMFFEKQEGVIKTLMVTPITKTDYILAKAFSNITTNIISLLLIYGYAKIFKEINVNIIGLIFAVILIALFHSFIGFVLTFYSKDFTEMLMGMMKYAFVLTIPVLLEQLGIIKNDIISKILYIVPTKASFILVSAESAKTWEVWLSLIYLIIASLLIYIFIYKKFDEFTLKESGV